MVADGRTTEAKFPVRVLALLLILGGLAAPSRNSEPSGNTESDAELMAAFETAVAAEIYVVRRDLATPVGLDSFGVRRLGCRYLLARWLPQWAELRTALAQADVRIEDAPAYGEMRVGLVLGDRNGTRFEIYASDLPMPDGRVKGYVQRRERGISGSFPQALRSFARAHRNLATVERERPHLCEDPEP